jgi:hypothetical protein
MSLLCYEICWFLTYTTGRKVHFPILDLLPLSPSLSVLYIPPVPSSLGSLLIAIVLYHILTYPCDKRHPGHPRTLLYERAP